MSSVIGNIPIYAQENYIHDQCEYPPYLDSLDDRHVVGEVVRVASVVGAEQLMQRRADLLRAVVDVDVLQLLLRLHLE